MDLDYLLGIEQPPSELIVEKRSSLSKSWLGLSDWMVWTINLGTLQHFITVVIVL